MILGHGTIIGCKEIERKQRIEEREQQKLIEFNQERENAGPTITLSEWLKLNPDRDTRLQGTATKEPQDTKADNDGGAE